MSYGYVQPAVRGDIVQDGSVNVVDIIALQKHLLNLQPLTAEQAAAADLNADGAVDIFDLALLKKLALH